MNIKSTALFALLVPGVAMLAACNPAPEADDAATPPAMTEPAPADTVPADAMPPADTMPADTMPADDMAPAGDDVPFATMDKNQDGGITQDELTPADMLHQHFSVADADGDGKLSDAEVTKHRADMAAGPAM